MFQFGQMGYEQRFQAFAPDYDTPEGRQTELADITKIDKVPVYMFNAQKDEVCEKPDQIEEYTKMIPSYKGTYTAPTYGHNDFW